jgi:molybdate transport system substrate-binding protein
MDFAAAGVRRPGSGRMASNPARDTSRSSGRPRPADVNTRRCAFLVAVVLAGAVGLAAPQRPAVVAAAASLNRVLPEIAREFEREQGGRITLVFGASGALTRQIRDGAPFELFLSADEAMPQQLAAAGLTRDAGVVYAIGRLAIFAPTGSPLAVDPALDGLGRLAKSGAAFRFAIANPEVAPYGQAAVAVLKKRGLWAAVQPHLVRGDTVAQAAQFASGGSTAGGLIAYSTALAPEFAGRGRHAVIADGDYPPLTHRMVLLQRAGAVAGQFYAYLQSPAARVLLQRHGFALPN